MTEAESILYARARALARRGVTAVEQAEREIISFSLGRERYGVLTHHVREVFRPRELSVLPGAEAPVYAVAPWRGILLTVLDLRARLGIMGGGITDLSHMLVLGIARTSIGVLIHTVRAIERLPDRDLLEAPRRGRRDADLLLGMTRTGVLVLNAELLLQSYG